MAKTGLAIIGLACPGHGLKLLYLLLANHTKISPASDALALLHEVSEVRLMVVRDSHGPTVDSG